MRKALGEVCAELSELVVRNGEGCNHLIRVAVTGAADEASAVAASAGSLQTSLKVPEKDLYVHQHHHRKKSALGRLEFP